MKLEDQVCSLELAKKLKKLGVMQESYCVWVYFNDDEFDPKEWWQFMIMGEQETGSPNHKWVSAFTVAELGEMLPSYVKGWRWHNLDKGGREYWNCESEKYRGQEQGAHRSRRPRQDAYLHSGK